MSTVRSRATKNTKIVGLAQSPSVPTRDVESRPVQPWQTFVTANQAPVTPIAGFGAACKRLCDLIIGSIAFVVLMPVFAIVAILIKLDSTGPALFHQERLGRNKELIKVYKFRTMYQNYSTPEPTATSFKQTQKDDPRVTRLGEFLRKTSLDELPQLFNVLQGTMSMVGPRPHPAPLDAQYKHIIPALESRYAVKPGLAGWATVNGLRGETARVEDMVARVEHDVYYIKNWTLWLDIKIIAISAIKGWVHRNAY